MGVDQVVVGESDDVTVVPETSETSSNINKSGFPVTTTHRPDGERLCFLRLCLGYFVGREDRLEMFLKE